MRTALKAQGNLLSFRTKDTKGQHPAQLTQPGASAPRGGGFSLQEPGPLYVPPLGCLHPCIFPY